MPCDYSLYPADWSQIRAAILERARNRCESCGVPNHAVGARDREGTWHNALDIHHMSGTDGELRFGGFPVMVRIVLTIAHVNHDVRDNDPANLRAWCQLCHNRHDAAHRAKNAAVTRLRKRHEVQPPLFDGAGFLSNSADRPVKPTPPPGPPPTPPRADAA